MRLARKKEKRGIADYGLAMNGRRYYPMTKAMSPQLGGFVHEPRLRLSFMVGLGSDLVIGGLNLMYPSLQYDSDRNRGKLRDRSLSW